MFLQNTKPVFWRLQVKAMISTKAKTDKFTQQAIPFVHHHYIKVVTKATCFL